MSRYEFKLPDIGEGVTEGEIVKWLITPGEVVAEDQPMVEVMTDKATVTITSPKSGTILETRGDVGAVVPVHSVLVVFDLGAAVASAARSGVHDTTPSGASLAGAPTDPAPRVGGGREQPVDGPRREQPVDGPRRGQPVDNSAEGPAATAVGDIREDLPGMSLLAAKPDKPATTNGHGAPAAGYFNAKPLATPATRKLARDLGVDLRVVPPSGPHGRVTREDVRGLHARGAEPGAGPTSVAPVTAPAAAQAPMRIAPPSASEQALEERIPLRGVRKRIFEGMARSKHTAAHFTFVEECDVSALKSLRVRLKPAAERAGVKLTFLPFFVKAVIAALKRHPTLNSAFDETTQEIVVRRYYHVGIASATEAGLVVPVVRDADRKSVLDIARDIARLAEDSKSGKLKPSDLGGSTFTITSLGQQGGLFATPILNFPEVAILGIHQIKQKPVVRDGQIVVGDVMLLSLSFDHRIIDGHVGAAFAYELIGFLEDPDRLFLEMA